MKKKSKENSKSCIKNNFSNRKNEEQTVKENNTNRNFKFEFKEQKLLLLGIPLITWLANGL